jgi:hypothetical protein
MFEADLSEKYVTPRCGFEMRLGIVKVLLQPCPSPDPENNGELSVPWKYTVPPRLRPANISSPWLVQSG